MERAGSSNIIPPKYPTKTPKSGGIVITEGISGPTPTVTTSIPASAHPNPPVVPPESFKRDPDQYMPISKVTRIMHRVLPNNAKIADDTKETIQECVSEFIRFITTEANKRCHREYRKTVTPEDVLSAMAAVGLGNYVESLTMFLKRYRAQDPERNASAQLQLSAVRRAQDAEGSSSASQFHLPVVKRDGSFPRQKPIAQLPQPSVMVVRPVRPMPVTPPINMQDVYIPTPPVMTPPPYNAADHDDEYVNLPQLMREHLMGNRGGPSGEGSWSDAEFDPFK